METIITWLSDIFLKHLEPSGFREIRLDKTEYYSVSLHPCCLDGVFASLRYDGALKSEMEQFKYYRDTDAGLAFVYYLGSNFEAFVSKKDISIVTSVPSFFLYSIFRRENHSEFLGKRLGAEKGIPWKKLLFKRYPTQKQSKLDRSGRRSNIKNAFRIRKDIPDLRGKNILIVDDVVSTGTTANEIARVLKESGAAKVFGLFVATGE